MGAGSTGAAHRQLLMQPVGVAVVLLVLLSSYARLPAAYAAVVGRKPYGFSGAHLSTWTNKDHIFNL